MSTAIIVDAACDLPFEFYRQNSIFVLPIGIVFGDRKFFDERDPEAARSFFEDYSHFRARDVFSLPPSIDIIRKFITRHIAGQFEQALIMCTSGKRSHLYKYAAEGSKRAIAELGKLKNNTVRLRSLRVMDTRTVFGGQALLAYEALQLVSLVGDISNQDLYDVVRGLSRRVHVLTVPDDLYYLRARASLRGERTVGGWTYGVGKSVDMRPILHVNQDEVRREGWGKGFLEAVEKLFVIVREAIDTGLVINAVMISYAGNPREIMTMQGYRNLHEYAEQHGVKVYLTIMSVAAGINVGPGSLSVAYCS